MLPSTIISKQVTGTHGKIVTFEILGVRDIQEMLRQKNIEIVGMMGANLLRGTQLIQEELKESIAGNRVEPRSVDTGTFINSIEIRPVGNNSLEIVSDVPYAVFLEFGTTVNGVVKISPRNHFRNTRNRNEPTLVNDLNLKVKGIVEK